MLKYLLELIMIKLYKSLFKLFKGLQWRRKFVFNYRNLLETLIFKCIHNELLSSVIIQVFFTLWPKGLKVKSVS